MGANKTIMVGNVRFRKAMISRPFQIDMSDIDWGILAGTFRPSTPTETREYNAELSDAKAESQQAAIRVQAAYYAEHLKTWNWVEDDGGKEVTVPIEAATIVQLPQPFWDRLDSIVLGYTAAPLLGNSAGS